jgi:L-seryl-tRNA(Ser) seleniumtransferase
VALAGGDDLARRLRHADPPVIARVEEGRVLVDLRAVLPSQDPGIGSAVRGAWGQSKTKTP